MACPTGALFLGVRGPRTLEAGRGDGWVGKWRAEWPSPAETPREMGLLLMCGERGPAAAAGEEGKARRHRSYVGGYFLLPLV